MGNHRLRTTERGGVVTVCGFCSACRQPCEAHVMDFGLGWYEYWGYKCYDTNKQVVSKCCDATVMENEECTINYEPDEAYG